VAIFSFNSVTESSTVLSMRNPSCDANLNARSIRKGSSEKEIAGSTGVRIRFALRSVMPSKGSIGVRSGSRIAIALMVKSRRDRSASISDSNDTSG
jgi:hypothetical protein